MIKRIRKWLATRKYYRQGRKANKRAFAAGKGEFYSKVHLENAYRLGYTDGKRDGLTIAREQATNSLKEILWQQNNQSNPSNQKSQRNR